MGGNDKHSQSRQIAKSSKQRPAAPTNQGPLAQYEQPDLRALQRAVARPDLARPGDILALQRTVGNRAVQRLLAQRNPAHERDMRSEGTGRRSVQCLRWHNNQYQTDNGQLIAMEGPGRGMNCHGLTYNTFDTSVPEQQRCNPVQGAGGVGVILQQEAGNPIATLETEVSEVRRHGFLWLKQKFVAPDQDIPAVHVDNLIVVRRGQGFEHSARVSRVRGNGTRLSQIRVDNVNGYGGAREPEKPLREVRQVTEPGKTITIYPITPRIT